ncbi:DNA/RNA nuclease SfsA [Kushneria marisflavi]|uniref:Sugar fermentation stimulation protein homolog n=1 Tax=Kushneria marisflavi TaxID=157779 RepID=A0A240URC0_9GAMM|nr:DNA/RNA nuclease SfsA [Kushneria marisflavi]ART63570.1 sugar fermentation stimulation protein SfsA [Kushneria marisflavi]RKD75799.1 sugar fermentation stimulation protein [Kushneria marisflavi]
MKLPPLWSGVLIARYKRFLADIRLDDGRVITAHCPNTGSMRAVNVPGCRVWVSWHDNPKRRLPWTWELIELPDGAMASIHTGRANALVQEAIESGGILPLDREWALQREVRVEDSRLDFRLTPGSGEAVWLEVKQVTLKEEGCGYFPDSVSTRGRRHLEALMALRAGGDRAVLVFLVAHSGIDDVRPAAHLDPAYARTFEGACEAGVEVMMLGCEITPEKITACRFRRLH